MLIFLLKLKVRLIKEHRANRLIQLKLYSFQDSFFFILISELHFYYIKVLLAISNGGKGIKSRITKILFTNKKIKNFFFFQKKDYNLEEKHILKGEYII